MTDRWTDRLEKKKKKKITDREKTVCVHILPEIPLQASGTVKQN